MNQEIEEAQRIDKIKELKYLLQILPDLERDMNNAELTYLRQDANNIGYQENGYAYHITPTVLSNRSSTVSEYNKANERRWELISELNLNTSIKGIPDFDEREINLYVSTKIRDFEYYNTPIGKL